VVFCSAGCSKRHKTESGCTGKRDVTAYVPLDRLDDTHMLSDYVLLEDTLRRKDSGYRTLRAVTPTSHPPQAMALVAAAQRRGTTLVLMPEGMSRRKRNTSAWRRRDLVLWRVEFVLAGCGATLAAERVPETLAVASVLDTLLSDPCNRQAIARDPVAAAPPASLVFLLADCDSPQWAPSYHELAPDATLRSALAGKRILEYPTITVTTKEASQSFKRTPSTATIPITQQQKEEKD
jgi:hypothetical protein